MFAALNLFNDDSVYYDPNTYSDYITSLASYDLTDKIIFNLLAKPYSEFKFLPIGSSDIQKDSYYVVGDPEKPIAIRPYTNPSIRMPGINDIEYRHSFLVNDDGYLSGWGGVDCRPYIWDDFYDFADQNYWFYTQKHERVRGCLTVVNGRIFWVRIKEGDLPMMDF